VVRLRRGTNAVAGPFADLALPGLKLLGEGGDAEGEDEQSLHVVETEMITKVWALRSRSSWPGSVSGIPYIAAYCPRPNIPSPQRHPSRGDTG
jgi:hypothetical protein